MYSSSSGGGYAMLVVPAILFSISMILIAYAIMEMASPSDSYVLLRVESDGLDVSVEAEPVNDALLIVNGTTVPSASYNGSLAGLPGWAGNVTVRFPGGAEYTLRDYLEEHSLVRPYGEYRLFQDHVVELETEETPRIRNMTIAWGFSTVILMLAMLWRPRPRRI